jgi:hypothetical protein
MVFEPIELKNCETAKTEVLDPSDHQAMLPPQQSEVVTHWIRVPPRNVDKFAIVNEWDVFPDCKVEYSL